MTRPNFPAVLALHGSYELIYLADHQAWEEEAAGLRLLPGQDRLIDSDGVLFHADGDSCTLVAAGGRMALADFAALIGRHLFAQAQTCITKVGLDSYAEGMEILRPGEGDSVVCRRR